MDPCHIKKTHEQELTIGAAIRKELFPKGDSGSSERAWRDLLGASNGADFGVI